jgi:transposase-like protein
MHMMPNRYPVEQRERATRMALDRFDEYGSAWAVAQALGPKLGIGPETLRKWLIQAQTDAGARPGPSSEELAEIKRLKKETRTFARPMRTKSASIFFARELDPRHR